MTTKVSPLQKIHLTLRDVSGQSTGNEDKEVRFSFIYGAGSKGLSPFELDLSGRSAGERLEVTIKREEMSPYLAHLYVPLLNVLSLPIMPAQLALEITVEQVEQPQEREIITAMKDYLGGGCGGSCDCGCH